ncbi:hypothetical protein [Microbacterium karelineae]|uniref:hypothetical protein n=1 Tax=Microbacterium karelineae TaxID=2654283 RepID=UPI0012EAA48A|nr:hypothetical protein [Microbacterium karelineae]
MRGARILAVAVASALALSGCSADREKNDAVPPAVDVGRLDPEHPGNGIWLIPQDGVISQITRAVREAGAVTYSGTVTELIVPENTREDPTPGRTLEVAYTGSDGQMMAELSADGMTVRIIATERGTYVTGDAAYADHIGIGRVASGWVCLPTPGAVLAEWEPLLDPAELVRTLLTSVESVAVMEPAPDAETTSVYLGTGDTPQGEMTISAVGDPLPRDFLAGDLSGDGSFRFGDWGEQPPIDAPGDVVVACGAE